MKTSLSFATAVAVLALVSCEAPIDAGGPTDPAPPMAENATPKPEPAPAPAEPKPEPKPAAPEPEPIPPQSVPMVLDLKQVGNKIVVSGKLGSVYQASDIYEGLAGAFPDIEVVQELDAGPHVQPVAWGNRVLDVLLPFFANVKNGHFRYEKGVTTLEGDVPSPRVVSAFQQLVPQVILDFETRDVVNRLRVDEKLAKEFEEKMKAKAREQGKGKEKGKAPE